MYNLYVRSLQLVGLLFGVEAYRQVQVNPEFDSKMMLLVTGAQTQDVATACYPLLCPCFLNTDAVQLKLTHLPLQEVEFARMAVWMSR